ALNQKGISRFQPFDGSRNGFLTTTAKLQCSCLYHQWQNYKRSRKQKQASNHLYVFNLHNILASCFRLTSPTIPKSAERLCASSVPIRESGDSQTKRLNDGENFGSRLKGENRKKIGSETFGSLPCAKNDSLNPRELHQRNCECASLLAARSKCFTIIMTEPNDLVESIHNRMPVILRPEHEEQWLDVSRAPLVKATSPGH